jgi:hypothetical protein
MMTGIQRCISALAAVSREQMYGRDIQLFILLLIIWTPVLPVLVRVVASAILMPVVENGRI